MFNKKAEPGPAAVAAATWWADKLGLALTNGTTDGTSAALQLMAQARRPIPTNDEAAAFISALSGAIQTDLTRLAKVNIQTVTIGVDYGPDPILANAAKAAGVLSGFPIKTCMWVAADHVTASLGYQGAARLVWASDEWAAARPECRSQKYDRASAGDNGDYRGEPFVCSLPIYHEEREHRYDRAISLCQECGGREVGCLHGSDRYSPRYHEFLPLAPGIAHKAVTS